MCGSELTAARNRHKFKVVSARWSGIGSDGAIGTFLITLTFLLSTPGVWQEGDALPFLSGIVGRF